MDDKNDFYEGEYHIDFKVKCSAIIYSDSSIPDTYRFYNSAYHLYQHNSIIDTPLRMSNPIMIIEPSYKDNIFISFDYKLPHISNVYGKYPYIHENYGKLVKISSASLIPIYVIRVFDVKDI